MQVIYFWRSPIVVVTNTFKLQTSIVCAIQSLRSLRSDYAALIRLFADSPSSEDPVDPCVSSDIISVFQIPSYRPPTNSASRRSIIYDLRRVCTQIGRIISNCLTGRCMAYAGYKVWPQLRALAWAIATKMLIRNTNLPAEDATMTNSWLIVSSPPTPVCLADVYPDPESLREIRISMASAQSPGGQGSQYGSGNSENGKSALSMSLGFLKNLTEKKNTRGTEVSGSC